MDIASKRVEGLVDGFFHELIAGRLTSASQVLQRISEARSTRQRQRGYLAALEGMWTAAKSRNDFTFLHQIGGENAAELSRTFARLAKHVMQDEFDRGFFAAWADYAKALNASKQQT